jgi:hypothetical protein
MHHSKIDKNDFSEPPSVYRRRQRQRQHRARHFRLSNRRPRHALRRVLLLLSWVSKQQRCEHKLRNAHRGIRHDYSRDGDIKKYSQFHPTPPGTQ